MLFNSPEFGIFLAVVAVLYGAVRILDGSASLATKILFLVASYAFYMSWNPLFALLLAFSTGLDYAIGLRLESSRDAAARRAWVFLSCLGNLGVLGFFKYGSFAWDSLSGVLGIAYQRGDLPWLDVALPVGISFYTFQSLSYTIDVYRRDQVACRSPLDFAVYVSFFPQLVAGPIVRSSTFLPQLAALRSPRALEVEQGLARIAIGLVKKVVFADGLGAFVDLVYASPESYGTVGAALAIYAYTFQIYFDFSGYSDIAIGTAKLFGIELPENFDRPYTAASLREFWRRWHISLSTWLRDYLYIPLGGGRSGPGRSAANLFVTMALGGLWHGAGWTYVLWGAYHGLLLALERVARARGLGAGLPRWGGQVLTFQAVALGLALFRAPSLSRFGDVMVALARPTTRGLDETALLASVLLAVALATHVFGSSSSVRDRLLALPAWGQGAVYALAAVAIFFAAPASARFIYFQF